jgi:hypothetical protein
MQLKRRDDRWKAEPHFLDGEGRPIKATAPSSSTAVYEVDPSIAAVQPGLTSKSTASWNL